MVPSKGILRGIAEGFLEFRSWGPDMGIFQKFWPTPRNPWVPHIWAPRTNFQKPFGYPTQNPLRGYHAKFQAIRHSSNRVQKCLIFIIKRRVIRFLNPFDVLRTMVIVSRSNFEHVGSGQGPE